LVILLAWNFDDLKKFSNARPELFYSKLNRRDLDSYTIDAYSYSGGSLHEFQRTKEESKEQAIQVGSSSKELKLVGAYGGGCRTYVKDIGNKDHYTLYEPWVFLVDSMKVLQALLSRCSVEAFKKLYKVTKPIDGAFYGWAFKYYLHKLAISLDGFFIEAVDYKSNDRIRTYKIKGNKAIYGKKDKTKCQESLRKWYSNPNSLYWYLDYHRYPNIDCMAKCEFNNGVGVTETRLAYIQITISNHHSLNGMWLTDLNTKIKNDFKKRAYIAILPSDRKALGFNLTITSLIGDIPLHVACY
jgi:hypothetical protein